MIVPCHHVVKLREDLKSGELTPAMFSADLYDVTMGTAKPVCRELLRGEQACDAQAGGVGLHDMRRVGTDPLGQRPLSTATLMNPRAPEAS